MAGTIFGILIAALLALAFFVLAKVFFGQGYTPHKSKGDQQAWGLIIFAVGAIIVSGWLVVLHFGTGLILKKLIGLILLIFGYFMLIKFPAGTDWQPEGFFWLGITIGLFCTFLGIYWLLF
ncbi:MAG: hypothetical protein ACP5E4_02060 [Candidatus Aenigmatarchaeota archaeon]